LGDDKDDGSFESRLAAAETRRRPTETGRAAVNSSAWGIGARVGVELLSAMVVGLGVGWGLDRWLHTRPIFLALGVVLGGAAGIANVWRLMAPPKG
jgi:ATP synthase protein I